MWPRNLWPESNFVAAPRTRFPASKFRGGAVTKFRARRRSRQSVFASVLTRCWAYPLRTRPVRDHDAEVRRPN
jgi:hypothetical protein